MYKRQVFQVGDNGGWPTGRGDNHLPGQRAPLWHSGEAHVAPTGVVVPRTALNETVNGKIVWCNYNDAKAWWLDPAQPNPRPAELWPTCRFDAKVDAQGRLVFASVGVLWFVP